MRNLRQPAGPRFKVHGVCYHCLPHLGFITVLHDDPFIQICRISVFVAKHQGQVGQHVAHHRQKAGYVIVGNNVKEPVTPLVEWFKGIPALNTLAGKPFGT